MGHGASMLCVAPRAMSGCRKQWQGQAGEKTRKCDCGVALCPRLISCLVK